MNTTQSVEQVVKKQFARVFVVDDWRLFKSMAEFYLRRSVFLKKADVDIVPRLKLLARNCQKRLLIGIGTELLLKAAYLKHGFLINKFERDQTGTPAFPFTSKQAAGFRMLEDQTYMLDELINKLQSVVQSHELGRVRRGLKIAKVFRNKEGHGVLLRHEFDASNYHDIEASLAALFAHAFGETLRVKFSIAEGEKGLWEIKRC